MSFNVEFITISVVDSAQFLVDSVMAWGFSSRDEGVDLRQCDKFINWEEPEHTPWMINMEHNHRGLEDHFPV